MNINKYKGVMKLKRILSLILSTILMSGIIGCGENREYLSQGEGNYGEVWHRKT